MTGENPPPSRKEPYQEFCLILGGRSGKSTLASAIVTYESITVDWTKFVRKGELAWALVIATKEQQASDIGRNMIFANIEKSPYLREYIIDDPEMLVSKSMPKTRTGVKVLKTGIAITAFPCSARVGRGYPIAIVVMDECAWYSKYSKVENNDQGIYDSIFPRLIQFENYSRTLLITTPGEKTGLAYDRYKRKNQNKDLYYCIKIPTWKIRTDFGKEFFKRHKRLSPLGYVREFGAEFMSTMQPLINKDSVEHVCRQDAESFIPYNPEQTYMMAIDQAFGDTDRFAIALGHVEEKDEVIKVIIDIVETVDQDVNVDLIENALNRVSELYKQYDIFEVYMDQFQKDAFGKLLEDRGCNIVAEDWTAQKHRQKYGRLRNLISRRLISLPNNPELVDEISGLQLKFLAASGAYTVVHRAGAHDDQADAVAEVSFRLTEDMFEDSGMYFGDDEEKKDKAEKQDLGILCGDD